MSNHLHLLITPVDKVQFSRFKSCLIVSENYLFTLYRYIEMNPVKANMVKGDADYPWSSYWHNALGEEYIINH